MKDQPRVVFDLRGTGDLWLTVDQLKLPGQPHPLDRLRLLEFDFSLQGELLLLR